MELLKFMVELDIKHCLAVKIMTLLLTELKSLKSGIACIFCRYFEKIKIHFNDSFPIKKILNLHNVIILTKSVLNKDKTHYYYQIFLEKCSYQLAEK